MKVNEFYEMVERGNKRRMEIFKDREKQYSTPDDRLAQFKEIASRRGEVHPILVLESMVSKQIDAFLRITIDPWAIPKETWLGILDDIANYMSLAEGLLIDMEVFKDELG